MPEWIDFKAVKSLVGFEGLLVHYEIKLRKVGPSQLRGRCPLPQHSSTDSRDSFNVNVDRNIWSCKSGSCIAARNGKEGGNILDFVCARERCSLAEGARKIMEWFGAKPEPPKTETPKPTNGNGHKPPEGKLPDHMVKELPFMQQIEIWFAELIKLRDGESDEDYRKRVLNGVKTRILDSYKNGKKDVASK